MKKIIVCVILVSFSIISDCLPGIGHNNRKNADPGFSDSMYEQVVESMSSYGYTFLHTNSKGGDIG